MSPARRRVHAPRRAALCHGGSALTIRRNMTRCEAAYRYLGIYGAQGNGGVLHVTQVPGYEWERVAADVRHRITSGELPPGAMLRGERAMADEYGVAIGTVRRALQDLRDRGLIVTLPHKGTYVAHH